AIHLLRLRWPLLVTIKSCINSTQRGFKRDAGILPGLDQRPIESRKQHDVSATTLEVLLDFREVVEVIFHEYSARGGARLERRFSVGSLTGGLRCSGLGSVASADDIALPDDAQAFEGQVIVD